ATGRRPRVDRSLLKRLPSLREGFAFHETDFRGKVLSLIEAVQHRRIARFEFYRKRQTECTKPIPFSCARRRPRSSKQRRTWSFGQKSSPIIATSVFLNAGPIATLW